MPGRERASESELPNPMRRRIETSWLAPDSIESGDGTREAVLVCALQMTKPSIQADDTPSMVCCSSCCNDLRGSPDHGYRVRMVCHGLGGRGSDRNGRRQVL
jgi:hypothetical protein